MVGSSLSLDLGMHHLRFPNRSALHNSAVLDLDVLFDSMGSARLTPQISWWIRYMLKLGMCFAVLWVRTVPGANFQGKRPVLVGMVAYPRLAIDPCKIVCEWCSPTLCGCYLVDQASCNSSLHWRRNRPDFNPIRLNSPMFIRVVPDLSPFGSLSFCMFT